MLLVEKPIQVDELIPLSKKMHGQLVKAVVDVEKKIMVIDAPLHSDQEEMLLKLGSNQENLWGINLHPGLYGNEDWIEFDSMINIRPSLGNKGRGVENENTQKKIREIINILVLK